MNDQTADGLFHAVEIGDVKEAQRLLRMGANVNAVRDFDGETPLLIATTNADLEMMGMLLFHGAIRHQKDANGNCAIHRAALLGDLASLKLLMQNGSLAFIGNSEFNTPLMIASMYGYTEIVRYLLDMKVPMMYQLNNKGRSELTLATAQGHTDIVNLLLVNGDPARDRSDELNQALRIAVYNNNSRITRILLDWGADPNTRDLKGNPLIFNLLHKDNEPLTRQLILKGADINTRDGEGYTLLMKAIMLKNAKFVRFLIELGADLNAVQRDGHITAKSLAHTIGDPKIEEIIKSALSDD